LPALNMFNEVPGPAFVRRLFPKNGIGCEGGKPIRRHGRGEHYVVYHGERGHQLGARPRLEQGARWFGNCDKDGAAGRGDFPEPPCVRIE